MLSGLKHRARKAAQRLGVDVRPVVLDDRELYDRLYPGGRFYNIGAGGFSHPCWTNIDHASTWYSGVQGVFLDHDLTGDAPLPIPDASAEIIYSSHTIEHIEDRHVASLLRECFRALRPGGVLRVTTGPDADLDLAALRRGDNEWFYWDRSDRPIEDKWLYGLATALAPHGEAPGPKLAAHEVRAMLDSPNLLDELTARVSYNPAFPGHHVSWWNADKLLRFFRDAGFDGAYRSGYGQSICPVLRNTHYFDNTHPQISLYVEAVR